MSPMDIPDKNLPDSHCKTLRQVDAWGVSEKQGGQCHQWSRDGGKMSQRGHDQVPRGKLDYVRPHRSSCDLVQRQPTYIRAYVYVLSMPMFITTSMVACCTHFASFFSHVTCLEHISYQHTQSCLILFYSHIVFHCVYFYFIKLALYYWAFTNKKQSSKNILVHLFRIVTISMI